MAALAALGAGAFNVVVVQINGEVQRQEEVSTLHVSMAGVALMGADGSTRCRKAYTPCMQVRPWGIVHRVYWAYRVHEVLGVPQYPNT